MERGIMQGKRKMEKGKAIIKGERWRIFLVPFFIFLFGSVLWIQIRTFGAWFGQDTCPSHWAVGTGYADAQRFQAPEDGTSTRLEILTYGATGSGTLRLAVYDDNSGRPNNKLWEGTDINYQPGQWCGQDVTTIQITNSTYYWFAFKTSTSEEMCYALGPNDSHEWKTGQPYANPFPNPWGSYTGHNANRYSMRMHYVTSKGTKGIIEIDPGVVEGGIVR